MFSFKTYVQVLVSVLLIILGSIMLFSYYYSKYYPIALTDRISLDAKLMFIRDMENRDKIDTIILGSSIALDNVNGSVLEEESKVVHHVLSMSAFSLGMTYTLKLMELFPLFPNVKRVVYSAQSMDFSSSSSYSQTDIPLIREYVLLGKHNTNVKFTLLTFKMFINMAMRRWVWEEKHLAPNSYASLNFDHTGSVSLDIYDKDIDKTRWDKTYIDPPHNNSYKALDRMIKQLKKEEIKFYFFAQSFRQKLVKENKKIRNILIGFHQKSEDIVLKNGAVFLNLHKKLQLEDKYFVDRTHFNSLGSAYVAKEIALTIDANEVNR